jgi:hypothetical protein
MLEKDLEEKCRKVALKHGCRLIPLRSPGNKGIHDRLLFVPGRVVLLEFKRSKNAKVQPLQDWWQGYCDVMLIPAHRIHTLTGFNNLLKYYLNKP